jgi:hypothetical protein
VLVDGSINLDNQAVLVVAQALNLELLALVLLDKVTMEVLLQEAHSMVLVVEVVLDLLDKVLQDPQVVQVVQE